MGTVEDIQEVVNTIVLVLLILSIVGATITLVTFVIFKDIRTYPIKLILYLCVCIIVGFTAFIISFESFVYETDACIPIAVAIHYAFIANFCWTFCIAFNFYQMIVRRNRESQLLEKWYHLFSWGLPACLCIVVGATQNYGPLGTSGSGNVYALPPWWFFFFLGTIDLCFLFLLESHFCFRCYIDSALARFLAFFLPGLIIVSANAVLFFFIGREIHETLAGAPKSDQRDRKKEFRVYISIFISIGLSWVFGYLMFLIPVDVVALIFYILFAITTPCQGLLIFLSYCINKKVAAKWAGLFGKCFPCCRSLEDSLTTQGSSSSRSSASSSSSRSSASASSASSASSSSSMM